MHLNVFKIGKKRNTYAGNSGGLAAPGGQQAFPDLPGENGRIVPLVLYDGGDDSGHEEARPAPADRLGLDQAGEAVAAQDFTHAACRHLEKTHFPLKIWQNKSRLTGFWIANYYNPCFKYPQNPRDLTRSHPLRGQLHHFPPLGVRERSAVEERPAQLINASTSC